MNVKSTTDVDRAIGLRIATLREAKGLSQTELGQHVGVTFQQIQKYEKGANRVSSGRLQQIAQFLEVPMSVLFGEGEPQGQDEMFPFLAEPGAIEILAAYVSIEDSDLRRDVLSIVRTASRLSVRQTD
ncbi:helix-turn-helix domain-containing protein [Methylobacterium sp. E-045]|uniref:helix-turn-helix domain-containing protein n=1 Tax=Methylobacterium sp. E-045 TaxID=2836575 RepID=UPI001FB9A2D3|nr:helix-turn-helix transcriptional regulator [Methylobacterium sp. E-045]MCJ2132159.1 helix-turn-helix domain-containing protein [Methylobacterium sp. E-045]